jgi:hypothetical protein
VKRVEILNRLTKNRDEHADAFSRAFKAYTLDLLEELQKLTEQAKAGKVVTKIVTVAPENHTKDYDRVIDMLSTSVDDVVAITAEQFSQYVRDEWNWKERFISTSSSYKNFR